MATTAADLLAQCKTDFLLPGPKDQRNRLASGYTAGGSNLEFTYDLGNIKQGATLAIGLNVFYVWAADPDTLIATVQGGYDGSTDANAALGAEVIVNPRYTDFQIFRALNQTLAAISSPAVGLFQVKQDDFSYDGSLYGYPLTSLADFLSVAEVRYAVPGYEGKTGKISRSGYRLETTKGSPDSYVITLFGGNGDSFGQDLTVSYRASFGQFSGLSSTTSSVGLPDSMIDIVVMGAALRLLSSKEIQRNDLAVQGSGRRAAEVPAGASAAAPNWLRRQYSDRIHEEAARLASLYPIAR